MQNNKYKMIVFDIDGTLLPFGVDELTPRMKEMFVNLKEKGYINVLCSGRDIFTVGKMIKNPYVDYFVGANGTFILDLKTNEYIFEKTIKNEDFLEFRKYAEENNLAFSFVGNKWGYYNELFDIDHWFYRPFKDKFISEKEFLEKNDKNYLITVSSKTPQKLGDDLAKFFKEKKLDMWVLAVWAGGVFLSANGITKAKGLKILGDLLEVSLDEMVAFGDAENDIEMLEEVGLGIAMGNGEDETKEAANEICLPVTEDGPYFKLKEKGFY
ncbi:YcsE-related riboflavin metabolism phosphatase [Mycoplasma struthionis]|uniref:Cof-type HAD-IIB family hydrolase n=1 Tax=Mycoplasma struthionis TaxID=538220 RepID=A0A3G8LIR5_9MOLU|nr:Cof-type HAD-IIB family hydrolase [Mycoplasma struthionis]AZG68770.1 Cof-type HAD-IIB family hydrolase [Mycoplasma struthionis]TPI01541.1 Cof-type HAD-IIB family hydrolase [Mycoplasma struthionis]